MRLSRGLAKQKGKPLTPSRAAAFATLAYYGTKTHICANSADLRNTQKTETGPLLSKQRGVGCWSLLNGWMDGWMWMDRHRLMRRVVSQSFVPVCLEVLVVEGSLKVSIAKASHHDGAAAGKKNTNRATSAHRGTDRQCRQTGRQADKRVPALYHPVPFLPNPVLSCPVPHASPCPSWPSWPGPRPRGGSTRRRQSGGRP